MLKVPIFRAANGRIGGMGCDVHGCDKVIYRRAWCRKHYARWLKYGDPLHLRNAASEYRSFEGVIAKRVPTFGTSGCWEWTGYRDRAGYGTLGFGGKAKRAHRYVYENMVGEIPKGKLLRHSCDNPPCVNPAHLLPGSPMENSMDSVSRDRQQRGSRHHGAKLNEELVLELRRRHHAGGVTYTALAAEFGVHVEVMRQAIIGKTWKLVPQP